MSLSMNLAEFLANVPGHADVENRVEKALALFKKLSITSVETLACAEVGELKLVLTGPEGDENVGVLSFLTSTCAQFVM